MCQAGNDFVLALTIERLQDFADAATPSIEAKRAAGSAAKRTANSSSTSRIACSSAISVVAIRRATMLRTSAERRARILAHRAEENLVNCSGRSFAGVRRTAPKPGWPRPLVPGARRVRTAFAGTRHRQEKINRGRSPLVRRKLEARGRSVRAACHWSGVSLRLQSTRACSGRSSNRPRQLCGYPDRSRFESRRGITVLCNAAKLSTGMSCGLETQSRDHATACYQRAGECGRSCSPRREP